jgi:hypothetical protein
MQRELMPSSQGHPTTSIMSSLVAKTLPRTTALPERSPRRSEIEDRCPVATKPKPHKSRLLWMVIAVVAYVP